MKILGDVGVEPTFKYVISISLTTGETIAREAMIHGRFYSAARQRHDFNYSKLAPQCVCALCFRCI